MKFRKRPVVIDAVQFDEHSGELPAGVSRAPGDGIGGVFIDTLEGRLYVTHGDWIICGVKGEYYPCKPDIFEATYEPVEEAR